MRFSLRAALLLILALTLVAGAWYARATRTPHYLPTEQAAAFRDYWEGKLAARGAAAAADEIERAYASDAPDERHFSMHIFGELLFEEGGLDAIAQCSSAFGYGCYHGFFTTAIGTLGEAAVGKLDQVCLSLGGGLTTEACQHGVGHGILEYLGPQRIKEALAWCDTKVADVFPALGCKSGVFMEYFAPQLVPELTPPYDPAHPYGICGELPAAQARTCVYERAVVWHDQAQLAPQRVGELCGALEEKSVRESCYIGYGNFIAPLYSFDIEKATGECDAMSPEGAALCRAGIYWSLTQDGQPERATTACEGLTPALAAQCTAKGRFACSLESSCAE